MINGWPPMLARSAVQIMNQLGVADPHFVADGNAEPNERTIADILARLGGPAELCLSTALLSLRQVAQLCCSSWEGKPQRFLRKIADHWALDLAAEFERSGMAAEQADALSVLWLQNVTNAPILSSQSAGFRRFIASHAVSEDDVLDAADQIGINVAVLDELMHLRHRLTSATAATAADAEQIAVESGRPGPA